MSEESREVRVLDHGYVRLVETWGSDERIVEAARMSTQKGFLGWGTSGAPGDEKLLGFLFNSKPQHSTPFEMAGLIVEVQAPIFVFREWHRHRTQSYNEASARYAPLPDIDYVPSVERSIRGGGHLTKQAGAASEVAFTADDAREMRADFEVHYARTEVLYQKWLGRGAPKELARLPLAVGRYSRMRASALLLNWLKFLTLRDHPKAQWEIQEYARAVGTFVAEAFPRTYGLWDASRQ